MADPESPSTMLLRELQGVLKAPEDTHSGYHEADTPSNLQYSDEHGGGSTPRGNAFQTSHIVSDSTEEDDDPPQSLMFGEQQQKAVGSDRVLNVGHRSQQTTNLFVLDSVTQAPSTAGNRRPFNSPGPFRRSSTSRSRSTSPSSSPDPSTMNTFTSHLDNEQVNTLSAAGTGSSSKGERRTTFREAPVPLPPMSHSRQTSSSTTIGRTIKGEGYSDSMVQPLGRKNKGKGRENTRKNAGRKYQSLQYQDEEEDAREDRHVAPKVVSGKTGLSDYERALWKWVNVEDLDGFLQEVYNYYKGKGIYCIALSRVLNLLTTFFVIAFSTFLISCIDYSKLVRSASGPNTVGRLEDVLIGQCLTRGSLTHMLFIFILSAFFIFQLASFIFSMPRLIEMYRFYTHLLGIPDADIQTLPWPEIVRLIGEIRKHNPLTSLSNGKTSALANMIDGTTEGAVKRLDAHDVANRILRQENYLIALFNKDLLDLRVRIPLFHALDNMFPSTLIITSAEPSLPYNQAIAERKYLSFGANHLTKALEWNLRFCLLEYLFDQRGQVRKEFVRERRRKDLVQGLKRRFIFMGILNAIFAPFIIIYLLLYSFFRYFEEYHKNPSSIGSRQYTPYAQWKFREFNELPHLFERRLDRSYQTAKQYVDQFPKERMALVMKFVAFVAGSFAAVLLVASLIDPDLFLHFEITPHRTVLFYLGIFGSVLAVSRGMVPEENMVFDPEASLKEVVRWTHYLPSDWRGKLHSQTVHQEFSKLFALKIMIFFSELLSVILTPFILFFSLPPCASAIIDFFREFTVHVDGVGYVCSFAVFDFTNQENTKFGAATNHGAREPIGNDLMPLRQSDTSPPLLKTDTYDWQANENKMEKSFLHFKATHPDWQPSNPNSSAFLEKLANIKHCYLSPPATVGGGTEMALTGSAHAGGRGLGLNGSVIGDMEEARLRARGRTYEQAWAKSANLHLPSMPPSGRNRSEIIEEDEEEEMSAGEWSKRVKDRRKGDEEQDGLWKDEGVVGLLQQVFGR
ncbi:hypothetical protein L204_103527 [Cryptococcus depauperatus]